MMDEYDEEDRGGDESYERTKILRDLHHNKWRDELISDLFQFVYTRVLTHTERIIVEDKINGLTNGEIAVAMKIRLPTVVRHITAIKKKYRNQMKTRVDHYQGKLYDRQKELEGKKIVGDDGDIETLCEHGVGHGINVHTCDGCCQKKGARLK
jgi:DNA-binding CsgD family transcriptional regulator